MALAILDCSPSYALNMTTILIPTADGTFIAYFSERGLAGLDFPTDRSAPRAVTREPSVPSNAWLRLTERALKQALAGKTPDQLPPLDLSSGTEFQRLVWNA